MSPLLRWGTTVLFSFAMAACGGGGGSTGGGVAYSGATTAAQINDQNAVEMSQSVIGAKDTGSAVAVVSAAEAENRAEIIQLARTLAGVAKKRGENRPTFPDSPVFAGVQDSGTDYGCTGTVRWSWTANEINGDYTETLTFTDYSDDCLSYLNGTIRFASSGSRETLSFESLNYQAGGANWTLGGTMVYQAVSTYVDRMTMNLVQRDELTGKTYKLENYVIEDDLNNQSISISGKFYHHDHGYVTISTPMLLTYDSTGALIGGSLRIEGANNASVTVTFNSDASYAVAVDGDGDGAAEQTIDCTSTGMCT